MNPKQTPDGAEWLDEILPAANNWVKLTDTGYDNLKRDILQKMAAEVAAALNDLGNWIDRNHYQPVNTSDRWVQASGEIMLEIESRVQQLAPKPENGVEG